MRIRIVFAALIASLALAVAGVPTAAAATTNGGMPAATDAGPLMTIPMTGVAKNNKKFTGTYGIYKFVAKSGKVWAVGTLKGKLKNRKVRRGNVMMPATLVAPQGAQASQAGSCDVLNLVLGPIDLNLLGLRVELGGGQNADLPIVLDITAVRGAGLLGDLLCGLLDGLGLPGVLEQLSGQLNDLAATLNAIAGLLGGLQTPTAARR
jgi:hypothetical protein